MSCCVGVTLLVRRWLVVCMRSPGLAECECRACATVLGVWMVVFACRERPCVSRVSICAWMSGCFDRADFSLVRLIDFVCFNLSCLPPFRHVPRVPIKEQVDKMFVWCALCYDASASLCRCVCVCVCVCEFSVSEPVVFLCSDQIVFVVPPCVAAVASMVLRVVEF